ncbi:Regulator of rDNA transcription protein 15 [Capsicum annuum]|uniref:Regulator of rDNA transcription protein 15 n=1 Tax=Capsicum annuum TaxID=4072 RepID=A0A2G2Z7U3_CAPAN|nr:Regulator of rDNA transcription protein 15 [Capsicum annuum]
MHAAYEKQKANSGEAMPRHARGSNISLGYALMVRIITGNQNQMSFYPLVPDEIFVLVELILGYLGYLLIDVPPQQNSSPDNVFCLDPPAE